MSGPLINPFGSLEASITEPEVTSFVESSWRTFDLRVASIHIPGRLRPCDEQLVQRLVTSIRACQLIDPISVVLDENYSQHGRLTLIAGRHRLEAAKRLGWASIHARLISADATTAELIEIDSNLVRSALGPAEEALLIGRRKKLFETLYGPAKARGARAANAVMNRRASSGDASANLADAFTTSLAKLTGKSERSVQRAAAREAALGVEVLTSIQGSSLDTGCNLDRLVKAQQALRGEHPIRSIRPPKPSSLAAEENNLSQLMNLWRDATPTTRAQFLRWVAGEAS